MRCYLSRQNIATSRAKKLLHFVSIIVTFRVDNITFCGGKNIKT